MGIVRNSAQDLADATGQSVSAPQGLSQLSLAENTARYMFFETCALVGISLNQVDTIKARAPGFAQWGSAAIAEWADPACQIHRRDLKVMLAGKAVHLVFDSSTVHGRQLLAWVVHFIDEDMQPQVAALDVTYLAVSYNAETLKVVIDALTRAFGT